MAGNAIRSLIETELYSRQLLTLGDLPFVDEALSAVHWALATRPEDFKVIPGFQQLRVCKTQQVNRGNQMIPPLRIFFAPQGKTEVHLLYIEVIEPGDLEE